VDYQVFWDEAISQIKQTLSEQEFGLWFERIEYLKSLDSGIVIGVPSTFYRDQVKTRYLELIHTKLKELFGGSLHIEFEIKPNEPQHTNHQSKKPVQDQQRQLAQTNTAVISRPTNHPNLNKEYNFENFVIGDNNSFAANAAVAISRNPGTGYNPYLIYGGVGLGKTHLVQSIGNAIHREFTDKKIIYVTMESFTNEFIDSLQNKKNSQFKNKYRHADVLLIDDIHFIQNKAGTQEELFHTFNALYENNKQMVFTCDRPLSEIKDLTDRLRSRFERGLKVDLQPPNYETRYAILKKKIEVLKVPIPNESIELICKNITTNVRDLEAALTKLVAFAELVGREITPEVTIQQLKDFFSVSVQKNITIDVIQRTVANYFNLSFQDLKSKKKTKTISFPRQIAMYITREITEYSTTEIGLEFGGRDHTTVMHGHQRVIDRMKTDPTLEPMVKQLVRLVKEESSNRS
jgi:chromosomal replication initiator protein